MEEGKNKQSNIEEMKLVLEEWKTVIQTQMHFNEMIMRVRTTSVSVVLAVFGAAAFSLQFDKLYLHIMCWSFHAAVPIVGFGLGMLIGMFILDYMYYHRMLLGAVKRGYEIDEAYKDRKINGVKAYGMTTLIRDSIGKPGWSKVYILTFYGVIFSLGLLFLIAIFFGYAPVQTT